MSVIDRIGGASSHLAFKAPVRCATTANVTLSNYQTVDGILPTAEQDDLLRRVLVKSQDDPAENGVYLMDTGPWARTKDFDSVRDFCKGSRVFINEGTVNAGTEYRVSSSMDPEDFELDTDDITFTLNYDADISTIAGLAKTDGNIIVGDGTNWVVESGATARTSLGAAGAVDLASTANGLGAALVGVEDAGGFFAGTNIEAVLQDLGADVAAVEAAVVLKGIWDASAGTFPGAGVAQAGWSYIVSVTGTVNGVVFTATDRIVAIVDNASTTTYAANWHKLDYTDLVLSVASKTGAVTLVQADIGGLTTADSPQFAGVNIGHASDTSLTRVSSGVIAVEGLTQLSTANIGVSVQGYDAATLKSNVAATLTVGFASTSFSLGTVSTGTLTPASSNGNYQHVINGGGHALAPPSSPTSILLEYVNSTAPGTITTTGFHKVSGSPSTGNSLSYQGFINKSNSIATLAWVST